MIFAAFPIYLTYSFVKKQNAVYNAIMDEYTGDMSDEELLRWEIRVNPNRKAFLEYVINSNKEREEKSQNE